MLVSQVMRPQVAWVDAHASIRDVARAMRTADREALLVGRPPDSSGVVTDQEIASAVADGVNLATTPIASVARGLVAIRRDTPIERVARLFRDRAANAILVVDDRKRLVGVVAPVDLLIAVRPRAPIPTPEMVPTLS